MRVCGRRNVTEPKFTFLLYEDYNVILFSIPCVSLSSKSLRPLYIYVRPEYVGCQVCKIKFGLCQEEELFLLLIRPTLIYHTLTYTHTHTNIKISCRRTHQTSQEKGFDKLKSVHDKNPDIVYLCPPTLGSTLKNVKNWAIMVVYIFLDKIDKLDKIPGLENISKIFLGAERVGNMSLEFLSFI